jgi:hypothetical protein
MVFTIFGCLFVETIKNKVSSWSFELFTNFENPSSNPSQEACSGFQLAAGDF